MLSGGAAFQADVLVVGGGMAGLTAAYVAAGAGATVVVVERAGEVGGSAALSGAFLWTATSYESLREQCPTGDPDLQRAFCDTFPEAVEWVRSTGVEVSEPRDVLFGRGHRFDVLTYLAKAVRAVEAAGGHVLRSSVVEHLLVDGNRVAGARVRDVDGVTDVTAGATVLATGGFQGNRALLHQYFGDRGAHLLLRSNAYSAGDGLRLASAVGAATAGRMDTFYGHLIAWPLPEFLPKDFVRLALVYSATGVLVNLAGERFADESLGDHVNAQRVSEQPTGRAALVFDETVRSTDAVLPVAKGLEAVDTVREAEAAGARVASAPTLEALGRAVAAWGYDGDRMVASVEAYNAGLDDADRLAPPRRWNRVPVAVAPFHAIETKPGITFTEGGLRIDADARVLDGHGAPIPGLFAAGADTGGVFDGGYAGGLALAGTFGLRAARAALAAGAAGAARAGAGGGR